MISDQRGQLLEALLTLSSSEHGRGPDEEVDLAGLVELTLRERAPEIERRDLRVRTSLEPARIPGDRLLLGRLLVNLGDNAIHHNVPGGTVEVGIRREPGRVVLSVANTGQVVPAGEVDRLFEPFQRLHRTADGGHHGLGLSIVRAIARAHDARSSPGHVPAEGSWWRCVPACPGEPVRSRRSGRRPSRRRGTGGTGSARSRPGC